MPNALKKLLDALPSSKPIAKDQTSVTTALHLRAIDDVSLLRVLRLGFDLLRAGTYQTLRLGPFDDRVVAELGFFAMGSPGELARFQRLLEARSAAVGIPLLARRLQIVRH